MKVRSDFPTAFFREALAGVVHENVAHYLRCQAKELRPMLHRGAPLVGQADIGLVNQSGGLKRVSSGLVAEITGGESLQLQECYQGISRPVAGT